MKEITYAQIRKVMAGQPYPMTLAGRDIEVVEKAVGMGIDAHLEACFVPARGDVFRKHYPMDVKPCERFPNGASLGLKMECRLSPESLPVLLRRLSEDMEYTGEDGDDADVAETLASDILSSLGIENHVGEYQIVNEEIEGPVTR